MAVSKKHKVTVVIVVLALALIAYGAFRGRTQEERPSAATKEGAQVAEGDKELKVIKTWTRKDCSLAPWLITDKLGYFAEEGIKLVFTGELQPPQQIPSIINGDNDVSSVHPNGLAVAINGGAPFKGVTRGDIEPAPELDPAFRHMWWFINPEKYPNVKSFADLKDIPGTLKFSIISINQCSDFLANRILDKYGIPRDKIEWVTMPDVQAIQALSQKLTDVGGVHPPFYKGMKDSGALKIADSQEAGLPPETAGLTFYYFTEKFIAENHDTVKGFVRAIVKGQRFIDNNPEQARIWTEEAIGVPVSANHYYAQDARIVDDQIIPWLKDLEEQGVIPVGKLTPSSLVIHDFDDPSFDMAEHSQSSHLAQIQPTSEERPLGKSHHGQSIGLEGQSSLGRNILR
jgi:ABC-type nitrate/sulfonate/bicarbonate transport system substrate-binding protein